MTKITNFTIDNYPTSAIGNVGSTSGNVTIKEVALSSYKVQLAVFAEQQAAVDKKIQSAVAVELPKFGEKVTSDKVKILATQPDKWLILSDEKPTWLNDIADNETAFANEQSSSYSIIEITGQGCLAVMQQLSFIDWQTAKPVVLTQLASDYNGIVERLGDTPEDGYRIYVTRSMAKSFWEMLELLVK